MPTTEQIFYEARARPNSATPDRRPSIMIDDTGCVVQRGFMIPSRSSSRSSLARTATNSSLSTDGTPASPIESPRPGYMRPTGSLYDAPEFATLRAKSTSSLCPPSEHLLGGGGAWHPSTLERRQTWQISSARSNSNTSSRWNDDDLEDTKCQADSVTVSTQQHLAAHVAVPVRRPALPYQSHAASRPKTSVHAQHVTSEQVNSKDVAKRENQQVKRERRQACEKRQSYLEQKSHVKLVAKADADDAIASDGDDEEEGVDTQVFALLKSGIAAQRSRPSYATRRAISDAKAEEVKLSEIAPFLMIKPPTSGATPAHVYVKKDPKSQHASFRLPGNSARHRKES